LFASCKQLFRYVDDIHTSFAEGDKTYKGKVEFACYYSFAVSFLPKPLAKFQQLAPKVTAKFLTGPHDYVKSVLKEGKVEFGILMDASNDLAPYDCEPIHSGFFGVYESIERNPKEPIDRCIFTQTNTEVQTIKNAYKNNYKKELQTHMEVSSWEVLVNLIISNVGVGLFPDYLANVPYRKKYLRLSRLKYDPIPYTLFAVIPKGEELSKNALLLLNCLKEENYF